MLNNKKSVAIIGLGLVGRVLVLSLLRRFSDIQITCFDQSKDTKGFSTCGFSAAGMIAPVCESLDIDFGVYSLSSSSVSEWQEIDTQLGGDTFFLTGTDLVAHPFDRSDFERKVDILNSNEVKNLDINFSISELELHSNYNNNLYNKVLTIPKEGFVDVPTFYKKTSLLLEENKYITLALNVSINTYDINVMRKDFDYIFDTRGLGAKEKLNDLYGIRGESLLVYAPDVSLSKVIRVCHPRHSIYIVPRKKHHYYIGSTTIYSEDMSGVSVRSCMELLSTLTLVHKGFLEARIVKNFVNLRPTFSGGLPQYLQKNNLIMLNGFYRHGYLMSPALCHAVMENIYSNHNSH